MERLALGVDLEVEVVLVLVLSVGVERFKDAEMNFGREINVAVRSKESGVGADGLQKLSSGCEYPLVIMIIGVDEESLHFRGVRIARPRKRSLSPDGSTYCFETRNSFLLDPRLRCLESRMPWVHMCCDHR